MKKLKLKAEYSFDFHLIGIISKSKEYAVSWALNQVLNIELKKRPDFEIELKSQEPMLVSNFIYENEYLRYSLISNLTLNKDNITQKYFIPSLGTFDYLLKIEDFDETSQLSMIFSRLRDAKKIDSAVKLDVNNIKEKESFLF